MKFNVNQNYVEQLLHGNVMLLISGLITLALAVQSD